MRLKVLIAAVVGLISSGALAATKPCLDLLLPPSYWIAQREDLQKELQMAPQILSTQLEKSADEILAVKKRLSLGDYGIVHSVQTKSGSKAALKIYDRFDTNDPGSEFAETVLIQRRLSLLSAAPKVFGVIQEAELVKLLDRFPELKPHDPKLSSRAWKKARFAVLMDEISDSVHVRPFFTQFAARINNLPRETRTMVIEKMDYIQTILSRLRIFPHDAQILFSKKTGDVVAIDTDYYTLLTEQGPWLGNLKKRKQMQDLNINPVAGEHGYLEITSWLDWLNR